MNSFKTKIPLRVHLKPKQDGKGQEKQKIRIIVPFRSCPALNRKFKENSEKIKKLKNTIMDSFQEKEGQIGRAHV